jgi:curved DNA-binding protein CbpA
VYRFLGVPANADGESIKASYRKLSKLYHPDTTTLPLEVAAAQFLRLQKAYDVLSSAEERRFYDWNLAQEVSRQQGGGFVWPYEVDQMQKIRTPKTRYVSRGSPEPKSDYLEFSGQIWAALFFDAFALLVAILSAVYVGFFKH